MTELARTATPLSTRLSSSSNVADSLRGGSSLSFYFCHTQLMGKKRVRIDHHDRVQVNRGQPDYDAH